MASPGNPNKELIKAYLKSLLNSLEKAAKEKSEKTK